MYQKLHVKFSLVTFIIYFCFIFVGFSLKTFLVSLDLTFKQIKHNLSASELPII